MWSATMAKRPIWNVREYAPGLYVPVLGFCVLVLSFMFHCLNVSLWCSSLWSATDWGWTGAVGSERVTHPVGHWISVLPQHWSRWVTAVSSFDDRDWCQTSSELVWGCNMPSCHCVYLLPVLCLFVKPRIEKCWGKVDSLYVWFYFSWPGRW